MTPDELRERCRRFSFDVVDAAMKLGQDDLARTVRPQLLRAASGVATNYRAACRGRSRKEFIARLAVVVEESDEAEFWLDLLVSKTPGARSDLQRLHREAIELRAIFARSRTTALAQGK